MKENNLPENWLVFQEDTEKFRNNVIKYINNNYSKAVEGSLSNHYYGIYNSILIAPYMHDMDIQYKPIIITLDEFIELSKPVIKPLPPKYFAVLNDNIEEFKKYIAPFINEPAFNYKSLGSYYGNRKYISTVTGFSTNKNYILHTFPEVLPEHFYTIKQFKTLYVNDIEVKEEFIEIGDMDNIYKVFTISEIKAILETEYDKEDVTDIINLLNK